jgi:ATP:ADP antiporter, AAA family
VPSIAWRAPTSLAETALVSQMLLVPVILPAKGMSLLIPPVAMGLATIGLSIVPIVGVAILLSAADRGLNYSLQQATKETLYVPLTDGQKYKGKAVIDMFVDRLGKARSAIALIAAVGLSGVSIPILLAVALGAILIWVLCANQLGRAYARRAARRVRNAA